MKPTSATPRSVDQLITQLKRKQAMRERYINRYIVPIESRIEALTKELEKLQSEQKSTAE